MFGSNIQRKVAESWLPGRDTLAVNQTPSLVLLFTIIALVSWCYYDAYHAAIERQRGRLTNPLAAAIQRHDVRTAEFLLDRGMSANDYIDAPNTDLAVRSPLALALVSCDAPMVRMLLRHGAKADLAIAQRSPLMIAVARSNVECTQLLLEAGADPDDSTCFQVTVSDIAARRGDPAIIRLIKSWRRTWAARQAQSPTVPKAASY